MSKPSTIHEFLARRMADGRISSTSLIFTLFCDTVTQHGGEVWLGSVIRALQPLGLSERLVRTAVFRLQQDGLLASRKLGRRSYYRLSESGYGDYRQAARRIYAMERLAWDGAWTLVIPAQLEEPVRDRLRRKLSWQGFGVLAPGVYALPAARPQSLEGTLEAMDISGDVAVLTAKEGEPAGNEALRRLVMDRWNLDSLAELYGAFVNTYRPLPALLQKRRERDGHSFFLVRTMLIHEYRRILLRDPELPAAMLPENWAGFAAQNLTAEIYRSVSVESIAWIGANLENAKGALKGPSGEYFRRYGPADANPGPG